MSPELQRPSSNISQGYFGYITKQAIISTLEPDDWCDTDSMTSDSSDSSFVDSLATSDSDLESLKGKFHQLQTVVNGCT